MLINFADETKRKKGKDKSFDITKFDFGIKIYMSLPDNVGYFHSQSSASHYVLRETRNPVLRKLPESRGKRKASQDRQSG
jgi:hypothetical protein